MATIPLSGTNIVLVSGVPFTNDYKNTKHPVSPSAQSTYFASMNKVTTLDKATFQRDTERTFVKVNRNIDELRNANYLYFTNSVTSKKFYCFITSLQYVNERLTYVHFEVDVFQTWFFDMNMKPSFVIREHQKEYNNDGTPVIHTIDEGLNYGTDYNLLSEETLTVGKGFKFLIIVTKETIHGDKQEIEPTDIGIPQPLSYYFVPFGQNGEVAEVSGKGMVGLGVNPSRTPNVASVLKALYTDDGIVNQIVALYVTDYFGVPFTIENNNGWKITFEDSTDYRFRFPKVGTVEGSDVSAFYIEKIQTFKPMTTEIPNPLWQPFGKPKNSKLLMSPYSVIALDDMKGNHFDIKPEYVQNKTIKLTVRGSCGTSNKVSYSVVGYNYNPPSGSGDIPSNLEFGIIDANDNGVPIMNDNLASYIQGNRNSLQAKMNTIKFDSAMNTAGGVATSLSGLSRRDAGQVVGGVMQGVRGAGDGVLKMQALEAKGHDINNTPPTLQSMGGNTSFELGNGYTGVKILSKQIYSEYKNTLSDFFNMFGYKSNRVKVPSLTSRKYWNHIQTQNCNITGDFNNEDLNDLKNIFDNGITIWHTSDIGNYSLDNEVQ